MIEEIDIIIKILLGLLLFTFALIDIRKKELPSIPLLCMVVVFFISSIFNQEVGVILGAFGALIGGLLILISKVTRGKLGVADGIIFCITGFSVGLWDNLEILMYALFISAVYSIFLLVFRHVSRHDTIPFIPFVFAGYIGVLFL